MASPSEKLAHSLETLKIQQDQGTTAIATNDLSRTHRQRLIKNGFLQEVIKGWYIASNPNAFNGDSTAWYTSFWAFCAAYLDKRFHHEWCLSPEQSLSLHVGNWTVPKQLLVRAPKGSSKNITLPYDTALFDMRCAIPAPQEMTVINNMHVFALPSALVHCSPKFFTQNPSDTRTALSLIRDASDILALLLTKGHSTIAGRLAGGFRHIGYDKIADEIIKTMLAAGFDVRESNPFQAISPVFVSSKERSPYVKRLQISWQEMRVVVQQLFPKQNNARHTDFASYLKKNGENLHHRCLPLAFYRRLSRKHYADSTRTRWQLASRS